MTTEQWIEWARQEIELIDKGQRKMRCYFDGRWEDETADYRAHLEDKLYWIAWRVQIP